MNTTAYNSNHDTYTAEKLKERKRKSRKIKEERQAVVGAIIGGLAMGITPIVMFLFWLAFGYPL